MDWIEEVVRDVAELDYNSPVEQPSVMLVKASELRAIIEARAPAAPSIAACAMCGASHAPEQNTLCPA